MPGNPVSSFVTFLLLVRPFVLRLQGVQDVTPRAVDARANFQWPRADKRREFLRVRLNDAGALALFSNQSSGVLTSAFWADGLIDNMRGMTVAQDGTVTRFQGIVVDADGRVVRLVPPQCEWWGLYAFNRYMQPHEYHFSGHNLVSIGNVVTDADGVAMYLRLAATEADTLIREMGTAKTRTTRQRRSPPPTFRRNWI